MVAIFYFCNLSSATTTTTTTAATTAATTSATTTPITYLNEKMGDCKPF